MNHFLTPKIEFYKVFCKYVIELNTPKEKKIKSALKNVKNSFSMEELFSSGHNLLKNVEITKTQVGTSIYKYKSLSTNSCPTQSLAKGSTFINCIDLITLINLEIIVEHSKQCLHCIVYTYNLAVHVFFY